MSEKGYKINVCERHYTTRSVCIEIPAEQWGSPTAAMVHEGQKGALIALPNRNLDRAEWNLLKQAVDEAFDEYEKRWPR